MLNLLVFCANISKGKCVIRKENLREDQLFLVRFCQFFRERARASFLSTSPGWKEKASRPPVSASTNDENVVTMWKQVAVIACHTSFPTPGKGDRRTPACSSNKPGTAPKHFFFSPWSKMFPISWCFKRLACVPSMRERHIYSSYFFDPALHLTAGESHHHIKNRGKKKKKRQELSSRDHFSLTWGPWQWCLHQSALKWKKLFFCLQNGIFFYSQAWFKDKLRCSLNHKQFMASQAFNPQKTYLEQKKRK